MHLTKLLPQLRGFHIQSLVVELERVRLAVRLRRRTAHCPLCGCPSRRVHSRYPRLVADLPLSHRRVTIQVQARRFFCGTSQCARRIFCERLPLVGVYQRRTALLRATLEYVGLIGGGQAGARLATRLHMPTSRMTLLRLVGALPVPTGATPRVLGVDDWAWRNGRRYGTLLVDLEQQQPIDLLPDCTAASFAQWLHAHPGVD